MALKDKLIFVQVFETILCVDFVEISPVCMDLKILLYQNKFPWIFWRILLCYQYLSIIDIYHESILSSPEEFLDYRSYVFARR